MQKGVRIEIDVPEGLAVSVDPLQIEQVLTNLVQNATDAMSGVGAEEREGEKRITISLRRQTGEICLDVLDTGPGFPDKILDRAAEPFFTTKPSNEGTGLGLAICDAILREHGGRLGTAEGRAQPGQRLFLARAHQRQLCMERGALPRQPALPGHVRADPAQPGQIRPGQGARRLRLRIEPRQRRAQPSFLGQHRAEARRLAVALRRRQGDERAEIGCRAHPKLRALRRIASAKRIAAATAR